LGGGRGRGGLGFHLCLRPVSALGRIPAAIQSLFGAPPLAPSELLHVPWPFLARCQAEERRAVAIADSMRRLFERFSSHFDALLAVAKAIASLDALMSLAMWSQEGDHKGSMCRWVAGPPCALCHPTLPPADQRAVSVSPFPTPPPPPPPSLSHTLVLLVWRRPLGRDVHPEYRWVSPCCAPPRAPLRPSILPPMASPMSSACPAPSLWTGTSQCWS
jgi:hypothetical protein